MNILCLRFKYDEIWVERLAMKLSFTLLQNFGVSIASSGPESSLRRRVRGEDIPLAPAVCLATQGLVRSRGARFRNVRTLILIGSK